MENLSIHNQGAKGSSSYLIALMPAVFVVCVWLTLYLYGPTWDSALGEFYFGDRTLEFWSEGKPESLDFSRDSMPANYPPALLTPWLKAHPEHVWSLGPTLSAISAAIFHRKLGILSPVEARHVWIAALLAWFAVRLFRFARNHFSEFVAVIAVLCFLSHPRLFADAHNNIKDIPAMVFFSLAIMTFADGIFRRSQATIVHAGLYAGLSLASKPNAVFLPLILLPWMLVQLRGEDWKQSRPMCVSFVVASLLSVSIYLAVSPFLWADFPKNLLKQVTYVLSYGSAGASHFSIVPAVNVLVTTPAMMCAALVAGLFRGLRRQSESSQSRTFLLVLLWFSFPVLRASLPYANDFDGIRHYWEFWPAAAIVIGVGAEFVWRFLLRFELLRKCSRLVAATIGTLLVIFPLSWLAKNPAFATCYYNTFIGGLRGAEERNLPQATDYWGSSYRQGIQWLNQNAEPHTELFVGVAPHIVESVRDLWLRQDIELRPMSKMSNWGEAVSAVPATAGTPTTAGATTAGYEQSSQSSYLMFITRRERYTPLLQKISAEQVPVFQLKVDGASILVVYKG